MFSGVNKYGLKLDHCMAGVVFSLVTNKEPILQLNIIIENV